jgi:four helix bundle protein
MGDFKKLEVWQLSKDLAVQIYKLTIERAGFEKDFRFRDQIRSSAVSIASNIAEGDESGSNKQSIRYFFISKGSTAELITQLIIAHEIGYISENEKTNIVNQCEQISKKLQRLIAARKNTLTS